VIPVAPPAGNAVVVRAGIVIAAPVPLSAAPVLEIVGQVPAAVPIRVYGPLPVTDVAVNVVLIDVPPEVVKPLRL
jgi:hypothetical protein